MTELKFLHGGNLWEASRERGIPPEKIIDFSANINPWGELFGIKGYINKNMDSIFHYPDPDSKRLTLKLSEFLKVDRERIIVGNGATEIIYLIMGAVRPSFAVIPVPTFTEYERALKLAHGRAIFLLLEEEKDFNMEFDKLIKKSRNAQMIVICNPNNPTGKILPLSVMQEILEEAEKKGKFVVVDESFIDFQPQNSLISSIERYRGLFILRSFTKFFSIAGLRLGYGVGSREIIAKIKSIKQPWTVNSLAEMAGVGILENIEKAERLREWIEKEKDFLYKNLSKIKEIEPYPSVANFILIKIKAPFSSSWLANELAGKGILIRDCSNFTGLSDKFFRIAVRTREENEKLIYNLEQIFRSKV